MMPWRSLLILLYSLFMSALVPLLRLAALFVPTLGKQLEGRRPVALLAPEIARKRTAARAGILYFCSSAGEFEQAKPLIERFRAQGGIYQHVVFFSQSGHAYAAARGETTPYSLSPVDSAFAWGWLLAAMRPQLVVVVRHELWPGFLHTAGRYAPVCLIDTVVKAGEERWPRWKRYVRKQLYSAFDRIYAVSEQDRDDLRRLYGLSADAVIVAGDTKYDRVVERTRSRASDTQALGEILDRAGKRPHRLVLGSAHRPDVEVLLKGRLRLDDGEAGRWQLVLAPHDIDQAMLTWIEERCRKDGLAVRRFSRLAASAATSADEASADVVLVDVMGRLAEIYGVAEAAFVGGAMHHQVHNVLEPASHGLALAFGPFYKNSQEATLLVRERLAEVCIDPESVAAWWRTLRATAGPGRVRMLATVQSLTGASNLLHRDLNKLISLGLPANDRPPAVVDALEP
jgi:3-deoxy-D-manno-octulosonic-acid transferase